MSEANTTEPPKRRNRLPLILGLVLALAGGAGGFWVTRTGLLDASDFGVSASDRGSPKAPQPAIEAQTAFVPLDPIVVSLAPGAAGRHLRFTAELEVVPADRAEVERLRPRIVDMLNGYLRALDESDLEAPGALVRLRAQMLRRVQLVIGADRVRDLLVMEFVIT